MRPDKFTKKIPRPLRNILAGLAILCKTTLLLPIPAFMIWFNFTVDRSGLFHGERYEREAALALMSGENLSGYDKLDERKVTELYIENLETAPDTIALGSSRILQMTEEISGADSFFNCGMSGGDIRDIMGMFYLFDKYDKLPDTVIIALDPWLLRAGPEALSPRSNVELYNEFLTLKLGIDAGYVKPDNSSKYRALLSPSYFQGNVEYYLRDKSLESTPDVVQGDLFRQNSNVKMWDGSVLYTPDFRNLPLAEVDARARTEATTFVRMDGFIEPDKSMCELFDKFIQYVKSRDVNIVFVLMPYHPIVYTYVSEYGDMYPGFFLTEPWYTNYAIKNNIPLYGSYNPFVAGTLEECFFDGLHIRGEAIAKFYPGLKKVLAEQKSGKAGSPWVFSQPRVSYDMAQELIARRYEVPSNQPLVRGEDGNIYDEFCYIIHRYDSDAENAVLLASYAVSCDSGTIYRYDHDVVNNIKQWVIYRQFT